MQKYANMRGTYSAKHLKPNTGRLVEKMVNSQPTRAQVANTVASLKAVAATVRWKRLRLNNFEK